jgi:hypothetical protein
MNQTIVYPKETDDGIVLVYPNLACGLTLEEIARKDVPAGVPFIIVDNADLPDYAFFDAFEADFSDPAGYGIGADAWFAEQAELKAQAEAAKQEVEDDNNQPE